MSTGRPRSLAGAVDWDHQKRLELTPDAWVKHCEDRITAIADLAWRRVAAWAEARELNLRRDRADDQVTQATVQGRTYAIQRWKREWAEQLPSLRKQRRATRAVREQNFDVVASRILHADVADVSSFHLVGVFACRTSVTTLTREHADSRRRKRWSTTISRGVRKRGEYVAQRLSHRRPLTILPLSCVPCEDALGVTHVARSDEGEPFLKPGRTRPINELRRHRRRQTRARSIGDSPGPAHLYTSPGLCASAESSRRSSRRPSAVLAGRITRPFVPRHAVQHARSYSREANLHSGNNRSCRFPRETTHLPPSFEPL